METAFSLSQVVDLERPAEHLDAQGKLDSSPNRVHNAPAVVGGAVPPVGFGQFRASSQPPQQTA